MTPRRATLTAVTLMLSLAIVVVDGQTPAFRSTSAGVRLDVSVFDGQRPVRGLGAEHFEVSDNNVRQRPAVVETRDAPLDIVLLVPPGRSLTTDRQRLVAAILQATGDLLRPSDRLGIVVASAGPAVVRTLAAIDDSAVAVSAMGTPTQALRDALLHSLALFDLEDRRKVVLLLTDGQRDQSWTSATAASRAADRLPAQIVVAGIDSTSSGNILTLWNDGGAIREERVASGSRAALRLPRWLLDVARRSGGRALDLRDGNAHRQLAELIDALRSQYVITYTPAGVAGRGWHDVVVRLKGAKGTVVTRAGYWVE